MLWIQVDVVILEVGLGGKFDATNVVWIKPSSDDWIHPYCYVKLNYMLVRIAISCENFSFCWISNIMMMEFLQVENPVVCGIASLGYDHMEILG